MFLELKVRSLFFFFDGIISHAIMQAQLNHSGLRYLGECRPVYLLKEKEKKEKRRGRSQRYIYVHVRYLRLKVSHPLSQINVGSKYR